MNIKVIALIIFAGLLSACGGGSDINAPASATTNAALSFQQVETTSGTTTVTYRGTSKQIDFGARAHLTDVGSVPGLTGKGTWVAIVDDFETTDSAIIQFPSILRSRVTTTSTATGEDTLKCTLNYQWTTSYTHGDLVSSIAADTLPAQTRTVVLATPDSINPGNADCASNFFTGAPTTALQAQLSVDPIPSVAPQASLIKSHVVLGKGGTSTISTTVTDQWLTLQGHLNNLGNSAAVDAINMSLGASIDGTGKTRAEVMTMVGTYPIGRKINAVITVAAGNDSKPCSELNLQGCNVTAVALTQSAETQDSTIVVGALTGSGKAQTLANYSTRPGFLKDRFIWASGDTGFYNGAQGTSFAAPRVAGVAALLKQKYPQLNAAQISNLILDSADKDMNNDGVPDFTGSDPIFGRGKLSLTNALNLAAKLYP